jgi:hypothetical protein
MNLRFSLSTYHIRLGIISHIPEQSSPCTYRMLPRRNLVVLLAIEMHNVAQKEVGIPRDSSLSSVSLVTHLVWTLVRIFMATSWQSMLHGEDTISRVNKACARGHQDVTWLNLSGSKEDVGTCASSSLQTSPWSVAKTGVCY